MHRWFNGKDACMLTNYMHMASVVLSVWQIPAATATSLEEIKVSREISEHHIRCRQ
jgi:hypothetical protein